jgi:hypothetical protein
MGSGVAMQRHQARAINTVYLSLIACLAAFNALGGT